MKRLTTEANLKKLVAQFVPIKIDVESDDYKLWKRDHKPKRNAIPQMYIIRADGKELLNQVGSLPTDTLEEVMTVALTRSGVTLTDGEVGTVKTALSEATRLIEKEDFFSALKTVADVPGVMDESIPCYSKPVMELRRMAIGLTDKSTNWLASAASTLKDGLPAELEERVKLARETVRLVEGTKNVEPVQRVRTELESAVRKNAEFRQIVNDVKKFNGLLKSNSTRRSQQLREMAARYSGTSIEKQVVKMIETQAIAPSIWTHVSNSSSRTWTSKNGKFTVDARPLLVSTDAVRLENGKLEMMTVKIKDLSAEDQRWVQDNLR